MPNNIIYKTEYEIKPFHMERYLESLHRYDPAVSRETLEKIFAANYSTYDPLHVSCLVEIGVGAISDEEKARGYLEDHKQWFALGEIERLRRMGK